MPIQDCNGLNRVRNNTGKVEKYIGLASKFKNRFYKHKASMETENTDNSTTLSTHFWKETEEGRNPKITWKILENNIPTYNPVTAKCQLCIREKYCITFNPNEATLNSRNELYAHCRHIRSKFLKPQTKTKTKEDQEYESKIFCITFISSV